MKHKSINGFGRPCLVDVKPQYETLKGSSRSIAIPRAGAFFGSATWFDGEDHVTTSCGITFPDAELTTLPVSKTVVHSYEKWYWDGFIEVEDDILLQHLQHESIPEWFKELCMSLIKEIHYLE